jgi:hypothetical protein
MVSKKLAIIFIIFGSIILTIGLAGFIIYNTVYNTPSPFNTRVPNQITETDSPCDTFGVGLGHQVSGTDSYGFGFVSCVSNDFTFESCKASGNRDSCERIILIE